MTSCAHNAYIITVVMGISYKSSLTLQFKVFMGGEDRQLLFKNIIKQQSVFLTLHIKKKQSIEYT